MTSRQFSMDPKAKFEQKWNDIRDTISKVVNLEGVNRKRWNDSFSDVYALCAPYPVPLADDLNAALENFFSDHVTKIQETLASCERRDLLQNYSQHWIHYRDGVDYLNNMFSALNNRNAKKGMFDSRQANRLLLCLYGLLEDESKLEVSSMALKLWKEKVIIPLNTPLVEAFLDAMQIEKESLTSNRYLHNLRESYIFVEAWQLRGQLKLYTNCLEAAILRTERENYRNESAARISDPNQTISNYIEWSQRQLRIAKDFGRQYLHNGTQIKLCREIEDRILVDYLERLTDEAVQLIHREDFTQLGIMYQLLQDVPEGLQGISKQLQIHYIEHGMNQLQKIKTSKNFQDFVSVFLSLFIKYSEITTSYFRDDPYFKQAMDSSLVEIANSPDFVCDGAKASEMLARQCDALLKKGSKIVSEAKLDEMLTNLVTVFNYADGKDVFLRFYSRNLANRLINNTCISQDYEENMIQKLKANCGYSYTMKLQKMLQDIKISEDLRHKFQAYIAENEIDIKLRLQVHVLQSGAWPVQKRTSPSFVLPDELVSVKSQFQNFYNTQHNGRTLLWLHFRSTLELDMFFIKKSKPYVVICTTFQTTVLLLFNTTDTLNYNELLELSTLSSEELDRTLKSIVESKILTEDETNKIYSLNYSFSNKHIKFKISQNILKESPQERSKVHQSINEDRKIFIQAAIVRIMKTRKTCNHNDLISEVVEQSKNRFQPSISLIKKCIELLMEKQYLERVEEDTSLYAYMA